MGPGALARCVGDTEAFLAHHWGRRAHLYSGVDVKGLLGLEDADHVLTTMALRAPAFRVVKGGVTLDAATYTRRGRIGSRTITDLIDVGRVYDLFAGGATIVLQGLHRYWPPVTELCRDLELRLSHPVQANAYITPPVAQGLRVHADPHDVFAVQTHGRKQWVVYEGNAAPTPDGTGGAVMLDTQLQPGDCLYLPKGVHHAARTVDSPSIHLTVGVRTVTWTDVLRGMVDDALDEPALREPLPAGFAHRPEALAEEAARRTAAVTERLAAQDAGAAVERAARRFWTGRTPSLKGQLQQILRADTVDDTTVVRRRGDAVVPLARHGDRIELMLGDRIMRLPQGVEAAVCTLLQGPDVVVADLAEHLDEPGRRTLVRRLVREGVLMVVDG